jgi:CMP-N,N'-diacetyllegionaminic acid synthase
METPRVLCVVPAKAVSKRLPGKNLKMLAGKPLIAHILDNVNGAAGVDRVVVSTDSEEIKQVALEHGAEVPFMRPVELTTDETIAREVLQHALDWLKQHESYEPDYVLLVYPTSPLLSRARIEEAIRIAADKSSDSVVSGTLDTRYYWIESEKGWERLYPKEAINSQWMKPVFCENGAIYLTKTKFIPKQYVADVADILVMEEGENIDVDYPEDFAAVERILRERAGA